MKSSKINRSVFHHLYSRSMHPLEMVDAQYKEALRTWLCPACKSPRPGTGPINVTVEDQGTRNRATLNLVMGSGVPVARRDVLLSLGAERVFRDLYIGQVVKRNGTPVESLVTYRGRRSLLVRGSKNVSYRQCPECANPLYFSMIGERYLHGQPPRGADLFESQLWGLIFSNEIAKDLDLTKWEQVTHEIVPVRDIPADHLGDLDAAASRFGGDHC